MRPTTSTRRASRGGPAGRSGARSLAFSLVELLAVLAIIGLLIAVLIPTVTAVRRSVARARTQVQLAQWATACQQFQQEYGHWPSIGGDGRLDTMATHAAFIRALTARDIDGSVVTDESLLGGNVRRITFLALSHADVKDGCLEDAFGNRAFGLLFDRDDDGTLRPPADGTWVALPGEAGTLIAPAPPRFPATGVRAMVGIYSAGAGGDASDFVTSWR